VGGGIADYPSRKRCSMMKLRLEIGCSATGIRVAGWFVVLMTGLAAIVLDGSAGAAAEPKTAAVFDFELIDTSLEGEMRGRQPAETARLGLISDHLRRLLADSGKYAVIDTAPAALDIEAAGFLHACNGCESDIARQLGAELAVRGTVQKVSNLILNVNIYVIDAKTGGHVDGMSVDVRGNTDESWLRGVSYIVKNRLAADPAPQ
jgi:hypothetical protein